MGFFIFGYSNFLSYLCEMDNKLEHIVIKYLNEMYGDLKESKNVFQSSYIISFVRGLIVYMDYNVEDNVVFVYDAIWAELEILFNLEYDEIQRITTRWMGETFNVKDVITRKLPISICGTTINYG